MAHTSMKRDVELEEVMLHVFKKLHNDFPELIKYVNEMPFMTTSENSPTVSKKEVETYLLSLNEIYADYSATRKLIGKAQNVK